MGYQANGNRFRDITGLKRAQEFDTLIDPRRRSSTSSPSSTSCSLWPVTYHSMGISPSPADLTLVPAASAPTVGHEA